MDKEANALFLEMNKGMCLKIHNHNLIRIVIAFYRRASPCDISISIPHRNVSFSDVSHINYDKNRRVFQRMSVLSCNIHLDSSSISDVIVSNLVQVTQSNDPASRALVLRFFGIFNIALRDCTNIHHAILMQIDSHYEVELDAAVWASHRFALASPSFAQSLCSILKKHLKDWSMEAFKKSKLIPLAQHMHHSLDLMKSIKPSLLSIVDEKNCPQFLFLAIQALIQLELKLPLNASELITLIISTCQSNPYPKILIDLLKSLDLLAKKVPHHWTRSNLSSLSKLLVKTPSNGEKWAILSIFGHIINEPSSWEIMSNINLLETIVQLITESSDFNTRAKSIEVYVSFIAESSVTHSSKTSELKLLLMPELFCFEAGTTPWYLNCDITILRSLLDTLLTNQDLTKEVFDITSVRKLLTIPVQETDQYSLLMAFTQQLTVEEESDQLKSFIFEKLKIIPFTPENEMLKFRLIEFYCNVSKTNFNQEEAALILSAMSDVELSPWISYKLSRLLSSLGQHQMASTLYREISVNLAFTPKMLHWMQFLRQLSEAFASTAPLVEITDIEDFFETSEKVLTNAFRITLQANKLLDASNVDCWFACRFAALWTRLFQILANLSSIAVNFLRFTKSPLKESQSLLLEANNKASDLLQHCFDADESSLEILNSKEVERIPFTLKEFISQLLLGRISFRWPKFMFKQLQTSNIKLVINPRPFKAGDAVSVNCKSNQMVQIMGAIRHNCPPSKTPFRRINAVQVILSVFACHKTQVTAAMGSSLNLVSSKSSFQVGACLDRFSQSVTIISGEYFHAEFCLKMPDLLDKYSSTNSAVQTQYCLVRPELKLFDQSNQWYVVLSL
ncbi:Integrator complex subunit 7 [Cichlidogyrus casuarinus]|uniref:Integrator complex subunit 7 n=1 Tax=Cichlidogyrus casuarinus TaxID=1844966 RepID=A0ABD2Q3D0_9PLAT